jgi:hypothetical protein
VLTSAFEKPSNTRNLSTPPPAIKKLFPKSGDQSKVSPKKSAIGALTSSLIPKSVKGIENTTLLVSKSSRTQRPNGQYLTFLVSNLFAK